MDRQNSEWRQRRKEELRALKAASSSQRPVTPLPSVSVTTVDCACLIHGNAYSWIYVERLYNMIARNLTVPFRFHVYTEPTRSVSNGWIKHELDIWPGFDGPKRAWWYKVQLFNPAYHSGPLLYFDLDTVIVGNLDWVTELNANYLWAAKDFKCLWRPTINTMNSSVMWWNTENFEFVWSDFVKKNMVNLSRQYHGDQDYISAKVAHKQRKFFDSKKIVSWRWQAHDGGWNFKKRMANNPGQGTKVDSDCSVLIFHGNPKPHSVKDPFITANWI